ncbi:uncharacterized protein BJ212DRAFT_1474983 [Suillus subaureus]|uniref:Uncharacterized protein n=1 Tax=Suillus subaureus TaxID=48587 RepID=A0A9P7EMK9_9AGAM|nr:uncharacterized protein BJ212DRAFT_1474983 [Suillus subaureus]KAG1825585.1 hypothetical protein BJ212DRAFT_1474983 [Suillus subaureus]
MPNSQLLQKPSLLSRIGARVDDPPHHVGLSQRNFHSYNSKQRDETRLRLFGNNSDGKQTSGLTTGHAGRHSHTKQHVPDSSFVDRVPAIRQPTAFSPGAVIQEWNNHAYGILATVSISGSPAGSDTKSMSVDDGPLDSRQFRKRSSRMSVDPSPLTGTCCKASSQMSVDPSSPNLDQGARRKASSRMSVDVSSTRRSRRSSDRMLIDEIQHHYPTQNLPQQVYSHCGPSFTTRPTVSPTMTCTRNTSVHFQRERTLASSALPPTLQHISPLHDRGSPRGEANSASILSSRSLSLQHGRDKENQVLSQTTSPSRPCTSQPSPSLIPSSLAHPPGRSEFSPAAPPATLSPKHETPASRQGNGSLPTNPDVTHRLSPTSRSRVRARGSSSGDDANYKRHCVRQDSQPVALLSIDSRSACGTSPQSPQSLSPINETWLPPMEKQLEMARKSQLKARFREFKAIIGGAVDEIREVIVPYHKDHRKRKVARTNINSEPFLGVPDYLRFVEHYNPPRTTHTSRSQPRTSFDITKDIDHIAQTWTKLTLCDSPTALRGDDVSLQGEVPHLSLSPPKTNEPPMSQSRSPPVRRTAGLGAVTRFQSDEVEIYIGDAVNLAAPTFRRRRTADAFDANGSYPDPLHNNYLHHR